MNGGSEWLSEAGQCVNVAGWATPRLPPHSHIPREAINKEIMAKLFSQRLCVSLMLFKCANHFFHYCTGRERERNKRLSHVHIKYKWTYDVIKKSYLVWYFQVLLNYTIKIWRSIELIEVRLFHRRRGLLQNTLENQDEMFLFISGFLGKKTIFGGELPSIYMSVMCCEQWDRSVTQTMIPLIL